MFGWLMNCVDRFHFTLSLKLTLDWCSLCCWNGGKSTWIDELTDTKFRLNEIIMKHKGKYSYISLTIDRKVWLSPKRPLLKRFQEVLSSTPFLWNMWWWLLLPGRVLHDFVNKFESKRKEVAINSVSNGNDRMNFNVKI